MYDLSWQVTRLRKLKLLCSTRLFVCRQRCQGVIRFLHVSTMLVVEIDILAG